MTEEGKHASVKAGGGRSYLVFTDIITVKVTGAETNGKYLIVEAVSPPGSGPSFSHTHIPQETFQVLEGTYEIYGRNEDGKYTILASPGMVVHVPGGEPHGFMNVGDTSGRMILTYEPAGPMLEFFKDVGIPLEDPANLYDKAAVIFRGSYLPQEQLDTHLSEMQETFKPTLLEIIVPLALISVGIWSLIFKLNS